MQGVTELAGRLQGGRTVTALDAADITDLVMEQKQDHVSEGPRR